MSTEPCFEVAALEDGGENIITSCHNLFESGVRNLISKAEAVLGGVSLEEQKEEAVKSKGSDIGTSDLSQHQTSTDGWMKDNNKCKISKMEVVLDDASLDEQKEEAVKSKGSDIGTSDLSQHQTSTDGWMKDNNKCKISKMEVVWDDVSLDEQKEEAVKSKGSDIRTSDLSQRRTSVDGWMKDNKKCKAPLILEDDDQKSWVSKSSEFKSSSSERNSRLNEDLRSGSRIALLLCLVIIIVGVSVSVYFFSNAASNKRQEEASVTDKCEIGSVKDIQEPALEIDLVGIMQPARTLEERETYEQAVIEGYNKVSQGCRDDYERHMISAQIVHQSLFRYGPNSTSLLMEFELKISCDNCPTDLSFASDYPNTFGMNSTNLTRRLSFFSISTPATIDPMTAPSHRNLEGGRISAADVMEEIENSLMEKLKDDGLVGIDSATVRPSEDTDYRISSESRYKSSKASKSSKAPRMPKGTSKSKSKTKPSSKSKIESSSKDSSKGKGKRNRQRKLGGETEQKVSKSRKELISRMRFHALPAEHEYEEEEVVEYEMDDDDALANGKWEEGVHEIASPQMAETENRPPTNRVSLVISHCNNNLHWLKRYVAGIEIYKVTVISKCDVPVKHEDLPTGSFVIRLPNVGRCDHSIAFWMAHLYMPHVYEDDDIVVFLKDSLDLQRSDGIATKDFQDTLRIATAYGFGCVREPLADLSYFHMTEVLTQFQITAYDGEGPIKNSNEEFRSKYVNMADWMKDLNLTLPAPLTPVCYGGMFAITSKRITSVSRETLYNIEESLSRGNNIAEGHYAERAWAGLFSNRLAPDLARQTIYDANHIFFAWDSYLGALSNGYSNCNLLSWKNLPKRAAIAASLIGYDERRWNEDEMLPLFDNDLKTLSREEKEAVVALGLEDNFYKWSEDETEELRKDLNPTHLDHSEKKWDVDDKSRPYFEKALEDLRLV